ncbi:MAG: heterodisulfide reductase-related iron-sulfur binding cluster [Candidatus Aminicenantia bacterium]
MTEIKKFGYWNLSVISFLLTCKNEKNKEHRFCCGAGGGLMWTEEILGTRINHLKTEQVINTHAEIVSTACPFCLTMLEDGLKDKGKEEEIKVKDIAEIVAECL